MDIRALQEHNKKVIESIIKNNSRENFERKSKIRSEQAKQVAIEALKYIERKGTGTHESNKKRIDEVLRYYKPDFSKYGQ